MSEEEFYNKLKYNFFGTKDSEAFKELVEAYNDKSKKLELYKSIIKEVREYIDHAQSYGTMAQVMPHLKPYVNGDDVLEILDKAGSETNSSIGTIHNCCVGKSKSCNGYKWKYVLDKVEENK